MKTLTLLILLSTSLPASGETLKTMKAFLKQELSSYSKLSKESFTSSGAFEKEWKKVSKDPVPKKMTAFYGNSAEGERVKSCVVVPQEGREGPMEVGVCFNKDGSTATVDYLKFVEERGQKVREKNFTNQFLNMPAEHTFVGGKNVDIVSGATWSSEAVISAVNKARAIHNFFIRSKK